MATDGYGDGARGSDGGRGAQASSYAGNPRTAEGAHELAFDAKNARQAIPNPDLHGDGSWDATSQVNGPKELLGQNTTEGLRDSDYPSMPDPEFPGASGTKNQGPQGAPLNWDSVGPYEYPEFPKDNSDALVSYTPVWET